MPAPSLDVLQQQIAQREQELEALRQELQARQDHLGELTRRKEALQSELSQVEEEIAALGTATPAPGAQKAPTATPRQAAPGTSATTQGQPRLRDLVVAMLRESGEPMTTRQLCEGAQRRGYKPSKKDPLASLKARLQEMKNEGVIQRASGQPGYILTPSANGTGKRKSKPSQSTSNGAHKVGGKTAKTKPAAQKSARPTPSARTSETPTSAAQEKQPALREVVAQILSKTRKPLPGSELARQVLATGYQTDSKNFINVIWVGVGKMDNVERIPGQGYRLKKKA